MSTGLLDFFVLEGSECVEQLDGLLARAPSGVPDLDTLARNARALRGSATMAKVRGVAEVASALERIVKGLRDGSVQWTPRLRGAVVAAVDDCKILIHAVRSWGAAEDARAAARSAELDAFAPATRRTSAATPASAAVSAAFLASRTAEVAAGLQRFADAPGPLAAFADTLARIRALRGIATLLDLPPLAEVVAAVDDAAKGLEIGAATATEPMLHLFRAAALVLLEGSDAIKAGGRPDAGTTAVFNFTVAAQGFVAGSADDDQVVPIQALFPDDEGEHVLHAEPNPPTTPARRFKLEVVSQAEHLRRLVGDARRAADAPSRQRLGRELRSAVRALARWTRSFGEVVIADSLDALIERAAALEPMALAGLDETAELLASRVDAPLAPRIAAVVARATPPRAPTPVPAPPLVAAREIGSEPVRAATPAEPAPSGAALHDMLGAGLSGLANLEETPLAEPVEIEDDGVVPIQDLLYRGRAALRRAAQLGQSFRRAGSAPNPDELAELYDLLELAEAE